MVFSVVTVPMTWFIFLTLLQLQKTIIRRILWDGQIQSFRVQISDTPKKRSTWKLRNTPLDEKSSSKASFSGILCLIFRGIYFLLRLDHFRVCIDDFYNHFLAFCVIGSYENPSYLTWPMFRAATLRHGMRGWVDGHVTHRIHGTIVIFTDIRLNFHGKCIAKESHTASIIVGYER